MSRDPIRNELRGLDSWITREDESWVNWEEEGEEGYRLNIDAAGKPRNAPRKPRSLDPRDPDHSRTGIFAYHNYSG